MKKLFILFALSILSLTSCQEDEPMTTTELPNWLEEKIQFDEDYVSQDASSMLAYGVWVKTRWKGDVYFQYSNLVSSAIFYPISFERDTVKFNIADYLEHQCCSELVWRGNQIDDKYLSLFVLP